MPQVVGMHFVCHDDLRVTDHGNGTFDTGVWYVAAKHALTVRFIALHESRAHPSYRQGSVMGRQTVVHEGKQRWTFRVRDDHKPVAWAGGGSGEKGYTWL